MKDKVITINRQYGSGGGEIANKLGKYLDLKVYDEEILNLIAQDCKYDFSYVKEVVEQMKSTASFDLSSFIGCSMQGCINQSNITGDDIFNSQRKVIVELSKKPCIIIGRCADYILQDKVNVINVFVHGSHDKRCERIMKKMDLPIEEAVERIKKYDKFRAKYYQYYCERKWGEPSNYHLMLNTDLLSIEECVEILGKI